MTKEEALAIINPPAFEPTSDQIELARHNIVMENYLSELWYDFTELKTALEEMPELLIAMLKNEKFATRWARAETSLKEVNEAYYSGNVFKYFLSDEDLKEHYVRSLSEPHAGDCTGLPATCERCLAEMYFDVENTVTWKGKGAGYSLYMKAYGEDDEP